MCDIWRDTNRAELSKSDLERHLADIESLAVKWVVFSGGEPLMHSDLFALADLLRSKHIRVTLLSTGLLLKAHAHQIATHIDDVIVSLDGPPAVHDRIRRVAGAFAQLERGVHALHDLRPDFPISGRCTVQKSNHQMLRATASAARNMGLCSISFLAADLTSEAFNRPRPWDAAHEASVALTLSEIESLESELEALDRDWHRTGFVVEDRDKLQRLSRHFRAHLGLIEDRAPMCNAPWVSAVVEADGTVRPCFFHRPIGSLQSQGLSQILNGFEAQQFRMSLDIATNPVCKRCVCSLHLKAAS